MTEPIINVCFDCLTNGALPVYEDIEPGYIVWIGKDRQTICTNKHSRVHLPEVEYNSTILNHTSPGTVQDQVLKDVKQMVEHFDGCEQLTLLIAVCTHYILQTPEPLFVFQGGIAVTPLILDQANFYNYRPKYLFFPDSFTLSNLENELMIWDIIT